MITKFFPIKLNTFTFTQAINMAHSEGDDYNSEKELNENNNTGGENAQDTQEDGENIRIDEEQKEKLVKLPLGRIKTIIKTDPEVNIINQEAVFLVAKSVELFIDSLTKESYKYTAQVKKKTVQKRDVENAINNVDALLFLEGMLE